MPNIFGDTSISERSGRKDTPGQNNVVIEKEGTYYSIPTMQNGRQLSEDEIVDGFVSGNINIERTGKSREDALGLSMEPQFSDRGNVDIDNYEQPTERRANPFGDFPKSKPEEYTVPTLDAPTLDTPVSVPQKEEKGFFSRENLEGTLKTFLAIKNPVARAEAFANYVSKEFATTASGYTGLVAGAGPGVDEEGQVYNLPGTMGLTDIAPSKFDLDKAQKATEVTQEALTYEPRTEGGKILSKAIEAPFEAISKPVEKLSGYLGEKAEKTGGPTAGALTETVVQGAPVVAGALLGIKGGKVLTPTRTAIRANRKISNMINTGINKAVKPSAAGKKTASQVAKYKKQAREAVISITENIEKLNLVDETGASVTGTPKNLKQFSQAVEQTKRQIFEEYDALAKQTNKKGIEVPVDSAIRELESVTKKASLQDHSPATVRYAQKKIEALQERGSYTAIDAQESIQTLNQSLDNFYANKTSQNAGRAYVDALVANHIRKGLDKAVKNATGKEYQALKNKYGSLRTIEKDVTKASIRDANKNKMGLIDFTDVFTSFHLAEGLLKLDPATMTAGAVAKGAKNYIKFLNNPNRTVKNMFSGVEKNLGKLESAKAAIKSAEAKRAESTPPVRERPETSTTPATEPPGGVKLPRQEYTEGEVGNILAIREGRGQGRVIPESRKARVRETEAVNLLNIEERNRLARARKEKQVEAKSTASKIREAEKERRRLIKAKKLGESLSRQRKTKKTGPPKRKYEGAKPWEDTRVLSYEQRNTLKTLKADLAAGESPNLLIKEKQAGTGGGSEYSRTPSTNPEWFKNKGWTKKEVNEVIDRASADTIKGAKLGKKQKRILEDLMEEVDNYAYNQLTPEEQSFVDKGGWEALELREVNRRLQDLYEQQRRK